jgi:hypothetical protein
MTKKSLIGLAVLSAVSLATLGTPSKAEAGHGCYTRPYAPVVYPAYRSYYYSTPVVYSRPVYYSAPVYSTPVVYSPAPVVYSRPVYYSSPAYYSRPYNYGPSSFSFGYYGGGNHHHGGVSVRVGY